jgi:hypothetical protein
MIREDNLHIVLLEFPKENKDDFSILRDFKKKVLRICEEYCFKLGKIYILPKTYLVIVEELLQNMETKYLNKGYSPLLKVMRLSLYQEEYKEFLKLVLDRVQLKLENNLRILEKKETAKQETKNIFREFMKNKELALIFQLEKIFPREIMKIQDLTSILNERIMEIQPSVGYNIEVIEL